MADGTPTEAPFDPTSPDETVKLIELLFEQEDQIIKLELTKVGALYEGVVTLREPE